jgi:peptidyl-prolyl cis-trans isomerase C
VKRTFAMLFLCAFAASFATAQTTPAPAQAKKDGDPVVVSYGNRTIRQSELEAAIKSLPQEYQGYVSGPGKRAFAEDYLRMKMLAAEAEKNGLQNDPQVKAQIQLMRDNALANAQLERIDETIQISDADLQAVYEQKKGEFEQATARHILVAFEGSPAASPDKKPLSEEQAMARAEEIRKKITAGADFAEAAKTESDDTGSGARGGDLGSFGRGQMVPEFEKAVFEGKVGEVQGPVRTQFGYHLVQVQERSARPFDEVKPNLEREVRQQRVQEKLEGMKTALKPTFNDAYFGVPAIEAPPTQPSNQ